MGGHGGGPTTAVSITRGKKGGKLSIVVTSLGDENSLGFTFGVSVFDGGEVATGIQSGCIFKLPEINCSVLIPLLRQGPEAVRAFLKQLIVRKIQRCVHGGDPEKRDQAINNFVAAYFDIFFVAILERCHVEIPPPPPPPPPARCCG